MSPNVTPREHWAVTVSRDGEAILTIETNCVSGRNLTEADEACIRDCARHLLAFVGTAREFPPQAKET